MSEANTLQIRVVSHNIRYATLQPFRNELPWAERLPLLLAQMRFIARSNVNTIFCLQEVLHRQLLDVLNGLNANSGSWSHIGVGRDDGKEAGEYSPILYNTGSFECLSRYNTWLSPTPHVPSKGWDANSIRIATYGIFKHIKTGCRMALMSTHFDDQGAMSRVESTDIILDIVKQDRFLASPFIIAGDFNSPPNDKAYKNMIDSGLVTDLMDIAEDRYGEFYTFTGFQTSNPHARIDFLFTTLEHKVKWQMHCKGYAVMANRNQDDGKYISDHRAVIGDLMLERTNPESKEVQPTSSYCTTY